MPLMRRESFHRAEIFMRLRHLITREACVMFPLQAIKHADIAHRQRQAHNRFHDAGRDQAPARLIIPGLDRRQQPGQRAESQQRGSGRREAGPLIQQILESRTGFDAQDIGVRVFRGATEMQPKPIRDGAHPVRSGHLQIGLGDGLPLTWPGAQPGAALTRGGAGWALGPGFQPGADDIVQADLFAIATQGFAHNTNYLHQLQPMVKIS